MIKPLDISIIDIDGVERKFIITRFPATVGMEIFYRLPISAVPKIGDFEALKDVRNDIFKYVFVNTDGGPIALSTTALIDNHTGDAETALKIVGAMLQHNYSFFQKGMISGFLNGITARIPDIVQKILTQLSPALSKQNKPRSKN